MIPSLARFTLPQFWQAFFEIYLAITEPHVFFDNWMSHVIQLETKNEDFVTGSFYISVIVYCSGKRKNDGVTDFAPN